MNIKSSVLLDQQIAFLEEKREKELLVLKKQMQATSANLKPSRWLKTAIKDVAADQQVRSVFKKAVIGLFMGMVTDKIISLKPGKKTNGLLGMALNVGINLLLANRYAVLKSAGALVVTAVVTKMKKRREKKQLEKHHLAPDMELPGQWC